MVCNNTRTASCSLIVPGAFCEDCRSCWDDKNDKQEKGHKHSGTGTDDIRVMMMTIMIALYGSETQGCQNSVRTAVQFSSTLEFWCFAI